MIKALKRLTALLFVIVFACLSGCAGQTEKREIDYTFTKNNAASFIDDYLAEEYPAIGSLVEKINASETTESDKNGVFDLMDLVYNVRFYPLWNRNMAPGVICSLSSYHSSIDYLKVIDEETVCSTTKISDEESKFPALINMIFKRDINVDHNTEIWRPTYNGNKDLHFFTTESYVTTVKLSKKDYKKIRVGDPAKKVYDIDSAVLLDIITASHPYLYDNIATRVSFRVLSEGILAIRFKHVDEPVSDTGTVLDNLEVYAMDFIKFQEEMPRYHLGTIDPNNDFVDGNIHEPEYEELYVDFSINSADQVEFFDYK